MYHSVQRMPLPSMRVVPLVCATTLLITPASYAQAMPIDDTVKAVASNAVETVTSSPLATFGVGCAVGAVVGGLVVGLSGHRSKKRLKNEIEEVVAAAERAEAATRRAEALLAEHERIAKEAAGQKSAPAPVAAPAPVTAPEPVVIPTPEAAPVVEPAAAVTSEPAGNTPAKAKPNVPHVADQTNDLRSAVVKKEEMQGDKTGRIKRTRGRRFRSNLSESIPVIDRGEVRAAEGPVFVAPAHRYNRPLEPSVRAALINRRVPRFDESLYPDTTNEQQTDADMFETAMRAMEETISTQATNVDVQPTVVPDPAQDKPEFADASSYIEYLVHDEMERNRSESARRYSRAHLTMFEGTGDLGAAKKKLAYRPRHMQTVSKEA